MTTFLGFDGNGGEAVLSHVSACRQRNHDLDPTIFFLFFFFFSLPLNSRTYLEQKKNIFIPSIVVY
jgi:hypothetical protein